MVERSDWLAGGVRRDVARDRIVDAATQLLAMHGFEGVTVESVAAHAGCSRATLYRRVGGRREILDRVLARAAEDVTRVVAESVAELEGAERVAEAILTSVRAARECAPLAAWISSMRGRDIGHHLAESELLGAISTSLTGMSGDDDAGRWTVRVVLSLLSWPLPDAAAERAAVYRFVAPAFA